MDKELLNTIIKFYVSEYSGAEAMVQRTPEWYANMVTTCGGSCMSVVMDANKYKSVDQLIKDKVKLFKGEDVFISNPATIFGTMFESVAELIIAKDLNNPVYGTDITINNKFKGVRYSPDGLTVASVSPDLFINSVIDNSEFKGTESICLVEIKSPLNRTPVEDKIPIEYYHQLQLGLASIPICKYGLFVDCMFRKCSLEMLTQEIDCGYSVPPYDVIYHKNKYGRYTVPSTDYYARGFILLITPNEKVPLHKRKGWKKEKWSPGDNALNNSDTITEDIIYSEITKIELPVDYNILGFIPYKLVKYVKKIILKEDNYIDIALPKINEVNSKVAKTINELIHSDSDE